MKRELLRLTASVCGVIATWTLFALVATGHTHQVPQCEEDVVLVGYGEFEHGSWSEYRCGPAVDDYLLDDWVPRP